MPCPGPDMSRDLSGKLLVGAAVPALPDGSQDRYGGCFPKSEIPSKVGIYRVWGVRKIGGDVGFCKGNEKKMETTI